MTLNLSDSIEDPASPPQSLSKPTVALHVFSDTVAKPRGSKDFDRDAYFTHLYRSLIVNQSTVNPLSEDPLETAYFAELIDHLITDTKGEIVKAIRSGNLHPSILQTLKLLESGTTRVVINQAPRSDKTKNGGDYFLATTTSGGENYVSSLESLRYLNERISRLYRIPNKNHPTFDGRREQFRSSIIARTCEHPEHLERIEDLSIIPRQQKDLELAYVDQFDSLRIRARNPQKTREELEYFKVKDKTAGDYLGVRLLQERAYSEIIKVVSCLDDLKDGEIGIYENVADKNQPADLPGYFEIARKWKGEDRRGAHQVLGNPPLGTGFSYRAARSLGLG